MGQCIAGGAYLPALSDLIIMVKGSSFMGLGGPNLVKGATGQTIDSETLGGAVTHTQVSGVAHYAVDDDAACLVKLRELIGQLPAGSSSVSPLVGSRPAHATKSGVPADSRRADEPQAGRSLRRQTL